VIPPFRVRLEERLPDPGRLWIRHAPRAWPGPDGRWLDLARGTLGESRRDLAPMQSSAPELALDAGRLDDLLYLPPAAPAFAAARDRLARRCAGEGTPLLVQVVAGEPAPDLGGAGAALLAADLLAPLLAGDLEPLARVPPQAVAVWPLLPGLTDEPRLWDDGCARLAAAGVRHAQAVSVRLAPQDRRALAEGRDTAVYEALFHRAAPAERAFDRVAARHGLTPFPPRPLPPGPRGLRANRRAAAALALAAELWLRLGRAERQGEALYTAARHLDRSERDAEALAREGNLGVLPWLDALGRQVVEEALAGGEGTALGDLRADYLGFPRPDPSLRSG